MTRADLDKIFTYHAPKGDQAERYVAIRSVAKSLAIAIMEKSPESPEQTLALRHVQQAVMMANAAIAIHEAEL